MGQLTPATVSPTATMFRKPFADFNARGFGASFEIHVFAGMPPLSFLCSSVAGI